jgi:hypothetical protein
MRWIIALMASLAATPLQAQNLDNDIDIDSAVYVERTDAAGIRRIEPATRLLRGDRVVTILRWDAPRGGFTAVSAVPRHLALESLSHRGLEVSTDGGRTWRRLAADDSVSPVTTHLRWQLAAGAGRISYSAVVR